MSQCPNRSRQKWISKGRVPYVPTVITKKICHNVLTILIRSGLQKGLVPLTTPLSSRLMCHPFPPRDIDTTSTTRYYTHNGYI